MGKVHTLLKAGARLGECPRWDERTGTLFWVDIDSHRLHALDPATGETGLLQLDEEIGCFALREQGGFVAGLRSGFAFIASLEGGVEPVCDPEADLPHQRFNDGRCDPAGRFVAGTLNPRKDALSGHFYSLDSDHRARRLVGENWTSNGLAFSPDGSRLYYSDTPHHVIYVCDYDPASGEVANQREFFRFPEGWGRPDGAAVDSEGCYWSALYAGARLVRISPAGHIVNTVAVPALYPTMLAFGGPDLSTLYVTSARGSCSPEELAQYPHSGAIFSVEAGVVGLPEPRYRG